MFLESPRFPACPSFGHSGEPMYSVDVVEVSSGREHRNANWQCPRHRYNVTVGPRAEDLIQELLQFWHAMGGRECGFRYWDPADYQSCRVGQEPTAMDQPLLATGDSPDSWQLVKDYTYGALTRRRLILKPSEIVVANDAGVVQAPSRWSLDTATGLLTPHGDFVGVPGSWGGSFDVPVRFDSEFPLEIIDLRVHSVSFSMIELRNP